MGNKHQLKEPHPYVKWRDNTNTREVQSKPQLHVKNMNLFILFLIKSDTVRLISHMVYTVVHRGYVLQSEAIGNNGSEESDVTADCSPLQQCVLQPSGVVVELGQSLHCPSPPR